MYMSTRNGFSLATCLIEAESRNAYHFPSLRLGLTASQPSRRHHAQSLLHPSFHDLRTPHVLESHPKRAAPLSRRDNEWRHAVGSHSALRLYLADCIATPPQVVFLSLGPSLLQFVCIVWPLLNHRNPIFDPMCVFYLFFFCLCFSDRNELQL